MDRAPALVIKQIVAEKQRASAGAIQQNMRLRKTIQMIIRSKTYEYKRPIKKNSVTWSSCNYYLFYSHVLFNPLLQLRSV